MGVIGIGITDIKAERKQISNMQLNINNNIQIKNISEKEFGKETGLIFEFVNLTNYTDEKNKSFAKFEITGETAFVEKSDKIKKILKEWKDSKKLDSEIMVQVLNASLTRANLLALDLSREMNLPPPIPMPKIEISSSDKVSNSYIG